MRWAQSFNCDGWENELSYKVSIFGSFALSADSAADSGLLAAASRYDMANEQGYCTGYLVNWNAGRKNGQTLKSFRARCLAVCRGAFLQMKL